MNEELALAINEAVRIAVDQHVPLPPQGWSWIGSFHHLGTKALSLVFGLIVTGIAVFVIRAMLTKHGLFGTVKHIRDQARDGDSGAMVAIAIVHSATFFAWIYMATQLAGVVH